ncbi:DUF4880 domain-containing protein [Solimonas sp. K1W22B-7]|uniref:FecR family protein n=1 Tax=Solimonas sp. K1W22B-7 TaxID=2303331 RepID=UPI000E3314C7|nr:FecR domain-containing protein [Solimonas sp. K1W22B-7]AXQ30515.1 DUF4880 domain-containing protein [Solimonas sp. K1W22B-7]
MGKNERMPIEQQGPAIRAAWDWLLRLRQPDVGEQEITAWMAWYEASDTHKDAYDYMQALYSQLDQAAEGPVGLPAALWLGDREPARAPSHALPLRRRRWRVAAAAATIAACAIGLALQSLPTGRGSAAVAKAAPGGTEVRETFLADGSHVTLAAATSISVELTDKQRTIVMQQGAAYFTVAHSPERPFIVKTGGLDVRAVGTAFNVRRAGHRTVVTVVEGVVDVQPTGTVAGVRARAGTEVAWTDGGSSPVVTGVDPAQALSWRSGSLDYTSEPLESVIADINRYSRKRVLIRDAGVGDILIWGTVRTDGVEKWVEALPSLFPVDLSRDAEGNLVLSARRAGGNT